MTLRKLSDPAMLSLVVAVLAAGCHHDQATPPSMEDVRSAVSPLQESWDVHYAVTETDPDAVASRPRLDIQAPYMAAYETEDSTYTMMVGDSLNRVTVHFYDEEGDTSAVLVANRVILYDEEDRFEARGNVIAETPDDKRLESEHLVWLEKEREVRTPGFVRITTPQERVQGYDLIADENLDSYTLRRVTGQVLVEDDP